MYLMYCTSIEDIILSRNILQSPSALSQELGIKGLTAEYNHQMQRVAKERPFSHGLLIQNTVFHLCGSQSSVKEG